MIQLYQLHYCLTNLMKFNIYTGLDKQTFQRKNVNICLPISFNMCMFWLRNKKIKFRYALLTKVLHYLCCL